MEAPFRMAGNLYFVGTAPASSHLIDTGDGLLLLDTGYADMADLVLGNVKKLGYDPGDIRWIVHSHGHVDHFGATKAIVERTGAKTYIGAPDAPTVRGEDDLSWGQELGVECPYFVPDVLVQDRDVLTFGHTKMECVYAPGHTRGTLALFWNIEGENRPLIAGMHGGMGLNSLSKAYLRAHHLPLSLQEEFAQGLERLGKRHVDVYVGNHAGQNRTFEKAEAGENFVDPAEWGKYMAEYARIFADFREKEI